MKSFKKITLLSLLLFIACIFTSACGSSSSGSNQGGFIFVPIANNVETNNEQNNNNINNDISNNTNNNNTNNNPVPNIDESTDTSNSKTITFSKNQFNLNIGETDNIIVYVDGEEKTSEVTFSLIEETGITTVATVDNGLITALNAGSAVFKVSYEDTENDNYFTVTVNAPELPNLQISNNQIELVIGRSETENIIVTLNENDVTSDAKFISSDESIATVDENGKVTGISEGTATIIVHVDGANDVQVSVNVYDPYLHTIATDIDTVHLYLGHNKNIKVTVGGKKPEEIHYSSSDESIATVDENGKITAVGAGNAEITVQVDDTEEDKIISVISKNELTLELSDTENINLTNNSGITYTSDNESIVTVDESGKVTAKYTAGNANITVQREGIEDKTITVTVTEDTIQKVTLNSTVLEQLGYTKVAYSNFYNLTKNGEIVNSLNIPSVYEFEGNKYKIIGIGERALYRCTSLTKKIIIPETVTTIGKEAFYDCISESINIPDKVTTIGQSAFEGCYKLTNVNIPDTVTNIGQNAFKNCYNLANATINGNNLQTIENNAFNNCTFLRNINIPNSVTTIGNNAFYNCSKLDVTLHDNITSIGSNSFYCVENVTYNLSKYSSSKGWNASGITIANGITTIPEKAFANYYSYSNGNGYYNSSCPNLKRVTLPDSVTTIENNAFRYCNALKTINIPNNITNIGDCSFYYCYKLNINLPDNITIGSNAFYGVDNITYNFEKYPTGKGWGAYGITIADNITSIPNNAFASSSWSDALPMKKMTLPDSVTTIGDKAFYYCHNLESINIPDAVTSIGNSAFYYCSSLKTINIPDGVTTIKDYTFYECYSLNRVTLSDNVTTIGTNAFYYCHNLESINIPDAVTSIGNSAFYSCYDLNVTLPDNIENIGSNAFCSVKNLTYNCTCENYKTSNAWGASGVTIVDGVTYIPDYAFYSSDYWDTNLETINIPDSVITIGNYAFYNCQRLTTLTIPDAVTSIGNSAFYYCSSLQTINIPDGVTTIEDYTFYNCSNLRILTLGNNVTSIGNSAFGYCNLETLIIPDSVITIGDNAFEYNYELKNVTIGSGVTDIGNSAFYYCGYKSNGWSYGESGDAGTPYLILTIPNNVTTIGENAFYYAKHIYYNGTATGAPWGANEYN